MIISDWTEQNQTPLVPVSVFKKASFSRTWSYRDQGASGSVASCGEFSHDQDHPKSKVR